VKHETLPPSALRVLGVIIDAAQEGRTLTQVELCSELGWTSKNAVTVPLKKLRAAGLVTPVHNHEARTLRPTCRCFAFAEALEVAR
jgi:hypothetical protein